MSADFHPPTIVAQDFVLGSVSILFWRPTTARVLVTGTLDGTIALLGGYAEGSPVRFDADRVEIQAGAYQRVGTVEPTAEEMAIVASHIAAGVARHRHQIKIALTHALEVPSTVEYEELVPVASEAKRRIQQMQSVIEKTLAYVSEHYGPRWGYPEPLVKMMKKAL